MGLHCEQEVWEQFKGVMADIEHINHAIWDVCVGERVCVCVYV